MIFYPFILTKKAEVILTPAFFLICNKTIVVVVAFVVAFVAFALRSFEELEHLFQ